jgi:hypothetical protein
VLAKNNRCIEIIGRKISGSLCTSNKNGKVNNAPPKPMPERTNPLQAKIKAIRIN